MPGLCPRTTVITLHSIIRRYIRDEKTTCFTLAIPNTHFTCMKMPLLWGYSPSLALLMASILASASVSDNFKECSQFFYMQTAPAGIRGTNLKRICQRYTDKMRYATLYDGSRRIPLYSAYIFNKSDGKERMDTPWMYEPQVHRAALLSLA